MSIEELRGCRVRVYSPQERINKLEDQLAAQAEIIALREAQIAALMAGEKAARLCPSCVRESQAGIEKIKNEVAAKYGYRVDLLSSKRKDDFRLVDAISESLVRCYFETTNTCTQIARAHGDRHHTCVSYAVKRAKGEFRHKRVGK